jgi:hypothetical protein
VRIELPRDGWAELRERLTYGQARDIRRAFMAGNADPEKLVDIDIAMVRAYVQAWSLSVSPETPELADDDVVQAVFQAALGLFNGKPDPKDGSTTSTSTPEEPVSS